MDYLEQNVFILSWRLVKTKMQHSL